MSLQYLYGRDCQLGDEFDQQVNHFHKYESELNKVTTVSTNSAIIPYCSWFSNSDNRSFWLTSYVSDSILRITDSQIVFDDACYRIFHIFVETKSLTMDPIVGKTAPHVTGIQRGMFLQVVLPIDGIAGKSKEAEKLLEDALKDVNILTDAHKKTKCSVLINTTESRDMTLVEVFTFVDEFKAGQHAQYEATVISKISTGTQLDVSISNERGFRAFVVHLYICYRKLEMILEKNGFFEGTVQKRPEIQKSMVKICGNLLSAKAEFTDFVESEAAEKIDFFKMYPILKNLFYSYSDYLLYCMDNKLEIKEGEDLPEKSGYFLPILETLNTWTLVQIGDEWFGTKSGELKLLLVPPGFDAVAENISDLIEGLEIREDFTVSEPKMIVHSGSQTIFNDFIGLVDMSDPDTLPDAGPSIFLELQCPQKCSESARKWLCNGCGNAIKISSAHLSCPCGQKLFDKQLLTCTHPDHSKEQLPLKLTEMLDTFDSLRQNTFNILDMMKRSALNMRDVLESLTSESADKDEDDNVTVESDELVF